MRPASSTAMSVRHVRDRIAARWPAPRHRIVIATHHKVGTVLFDLIACDLTHRLGWSLDMVAGGAPRSSPPADVTRLWHGTPEHLPDDPTVRVVHVVRDPREVVVSGYLYHLHTDEAWCVTPPAETADTGVDVPLGYPAVPHCLAHHSLSTRQKWVAGLGGRSYQDNLASLSVEDGVLFELERAARYTIDEMTAWVGICDPRVLTVRLEEVMASFDDTIARIGRHIGLRLPERRLLQRLAARHDLGRATEVERQANDHVHDPAPGRWRTYFSEPVAARFAELHGADMIALGYDR